MRPISRLRQAGSRRLARRILRRHRPRIVGVTGTVGKTTTTRAIAAALATTYDVRSTIGGRNDARSAAALVLGDDADLSGPLRRVRLAGRAARRLLRSTGLPQFFVIEMAIRKPGGMAAFGRLLRLDVAVLTALGTAPTHVEFFPDRTALWEEKLQILRLVTPMGCTVWNADDSALRARLGGRRTGIGYGGRGARWRLSGIRVDWPQGPRSTTPPTLEVDVAGPGTRLSVALPGRAGRPWGYVLGATLAVATRYGVPPAAAAAAVAQLPPTPGRGTFRRGRIAGSWVVDESFNSSPLAATAALRTLGELPAGRRIAVLGEMLELGELSRESHRRLGHVAAKVSDVLVAVGPAAGATAEAARGRADPRCDVSWVPDAATAASLLPERVRPGDVILVKASRAVGAERVVEALAVPV